MKQTITKSMFRDAFVRMGRKDQFSYEGLGALFDHIKSLEQDTGEEFELDVIELCCDFTESSLEDALEETDCKDLDDLIYNKGTVIVVNEETVIYSN